MGRDAQLARGQLERVTGAAQGGQHVELVRLQTVLDERGRPAIIEPSGDARDPREDLHRLDIEIGALAVPGLDQQVDLVNHRHLPRSLRHHASFS